MPSLTADVGIFGLSGQGTAPGMLAMTGLFGLTGEGVTLSRHYSVDLGDLKLRLERLNSAFPVVDQRGRPSPQFQRFWQKHCEAIESAYAALADAVIAIQVAYDAAAQTAAAAATATDAAQQAATSVDTVNQYIDDLNGGSVNFTTIQIGGARFYNNGGVLEPIA